MATGEIACVLTEPAMTNIGVVLPAPGFHSALRDLTRCAGTLLVIDETHTISAGPGGWTARHGLDPDMLVLGKPIGSGVPGAVLGLRDELDGRLRDVLEPARAGMAGVGGTLAANALSIAAMRATLDHVLTDEAFARMDALGARLRGVVQTIIDRRRLAWHVVRIGGRIEYHFTPDPLRNGADGVATLDAAVSNYLHLYALQPRRDGVSVSQPRARLAGPRRGRHRSPHRGARRRARHAHDVRRSAPPPRAGDPLKMNIAPGPYANLGPLFDQLMLVTKWGVGICANSGSELRR